MYGGLAPMAESLKGRLVRAMADADQTAFQHNQEGRKTLAFIAAGRSIAFEQVMNWIEEIERNAKECKILAKECKCKGVYQDLDGSAVCVACGKDLGWYCHVSPKHHCEYTNEGECCVHCGAPEDRQ